MGRPRKVTATIAAGAAAAVVALVVYIAVSASSQSRQAPAAPAAAVPVSVTADAHSEPAVRIDKLKAYKVKTQSGTHTLMIPDTKQQCEGFLQPDSLKKQRPPAHPATSKQPNFIYLLIDDMGYDDLSMHHPQLGGIHNWVQTPNMNAIVAQGLELDNFYTTPMCSTSRAELLTGRYYPRTGSMYINSGWDFMNFNEVNMGEIFSSAGYKTAHFGKWHNGRTAGYTPSDLGFQDSYMPTPYVHFNNTIYINGRLQPTTGWMEDNLMGYALDYLQQREADGQPFLMYYPTFSVHAGWMTMDHAGPRYQRPAPPKYLDKFYALPLNRDTANLYAMLEHIDDQIGRLMSWLDASGLADNTYVFLGGDNGPALFHREQGEVPKIVRMPSGMQGSKHEVKEGGIRNFLAVRGPGVVQGTTSHALLGLIDVVPTLMDMAGLKQVLHHAPFDGISFANIIRGEEATPAQQERMLITMETQCIEEDFVPALGPDRLVQKPQPLLHYTTGGVSGLGFKRCIGVRYKQYKWLADASETQGRGHTFTVAAKQVPTGLYKFHNNSHVELACHEASHLEPSMAAKLEAAAASWYQDMLDSSHSFERVTFFLGLGGQPVANIVGDGAVERTPGRVQVVPVGVSGFSQAGDASWYRIKVAVAGGYEVKLSYQARHQSTFRVWVGPHDKINHKTAQHVDVTLEPTARGDRTSAAAGTLQLPQTPQGQVWEVKLEMTSNSKQGRPAIAALDTIIFVLKGATGTWMAYDPDGQEGVKDWKMAHGFDKQAVSEGGASSWLSALTRSHNSAGGRRSLL